MKKSLIAFFTLLYSNSYSLSVHPNITEENGNPVFIEGSQSYPLKKSSPPWTLEQLMGRPTSIGNDIRLNFGKLDGKVYYGFINPNDGRYPQPVFKETVPIKEGQVNIKLCCGGDYQNSENILGYRVVKEDGNFLYDGKLAFLNQGILQVNPASIVEGPFVNFSETGGFQEAVRISFETLTEAVATVTAQLGSEVLTAQQELPTTHHEITLSGLQPETTYTYTVATKNGNLTYTETYAFTTAPLPGRRKSWSFAYASDSRHGVGGGEREFNGSNAYMMKKIMALAKFKNVAFFQFTGDMIRGYETNPDSIKIEYRNWKRAIEPFAHYFPVLTTLGNHEALLHSFNKSANQVISVDRFPYATESTEAMFATQFVNPKNGPLSEDGASYDPNPQQQDFPPYQETVYYYIYDNVAMVVLNSNYWYAPSLVGYPQSGGNLHGYLMDQQLEWLATTLATLEADNRIDFVFVTQHTPAFPNGGHLKDDMWYRGDNDYRAVVKHTAEGDNLITSGILEQRDKFLKILMKNKKVVAILTGDEHNFSFLEVTKDTNIYPKKWPKEDLRESPEFRPLLQITNGSAGAPTYKQELAPWSPQVKAFSTQNAVVFFQVNGKSLQMEVINPDTLDTIWPLQPLLK